MEVELHGGVVQGVGRVVHHPGELRVDEVNVRRCLRPRRQRRHGGHGKAVAEAIVEADFGRAQAEALSSYAAMEKISVG